MQNAPDRSSRLALVTGASHGIGRAVTIALSRLGYDVLATARNPEELEATASRVATAGGKGKCEILAADIATSAGRNSILQAVQKNAPSLSLLVHAASAATDPAAHANLEDTPEK